MIEKLLELIKNYDRKYYPSFTTKEKDDITSKALEMFPNMNMEKYDDAMMCLTCKIVDGDTLFYERDIRNALICAFENRDLTISEWD